MRAEVKVYVQGEAILPTDVKLAFYRIAQEALNNAAKHSGADLVEIDIRSKPPLPSRKKKKSGSSQAYFLNLYHYPFEITVVVLTQVL